MLPTQAAYLPTNSVAQFGNPAQTHLTLALFLFVVIKKGVVILTAIIIVEDCSEGPK
jgi:hypothetical protein